MSEKSVKLTTGTSLSKYLQGVIDEGMKSALAQKALSEKEKQVATGGGDEENSGGGVDDLFGGSADAGDEETEDGNLSSKTMDDETEKLKKGDVKPRDIVDRLNAIRSGRSFKDDKVAKAMDDYINSLSKPEKVALFAFMKGIAQIVTGEVPGNQADDPAKHPSDVKMQKGGAAPNVKHIRPNVIAGAGVKNDKEKPSEEDTSAPAPITPKRR